MNRRELLKNVSLALAAIGIPVAAKAAEAKVLPQTEPVFTKNEAPQWDAWPAMSSRDENGNLHSRVFHVSTQQLREEGWLKKYPLSQGFNDNGPNSVLLGDRVARYFGPKAKAHYMTRPTNLDVICVEVSHPDWRAIERLERYPTINEAFPKGWFKP